jgi:hypothetical protein
LALGPSDRASRAQIGSPANLSNQVLIPVAPPNKKNRAMPGFLYLAERQGFEPWEGVTFNGFQDRRFRPLSHLSEI